MASYLVAKIDVKDLNRYLTEYGAPFMDIVGKHEGVELLAATPDARALEGTWDGNWTVIIRFEDEATLERLYNGDEYAPLKKLRIEQLTDANTVVAVPSGLAT